MNHKVVEFAKAAHGNQTYAKRLPYLVHLSAVYGVLIRFGVNDEAILTAAWLHDVLEDTRIKIDALIAEFGNDVAQLVYAVTDEPGANRRERHAATYPKIKASIRSRTLKLADRIANIEACFNNDGMDSMFSMYSKEFDDFIKHLFPAGQPEEPGRDIEDAMWKYLIGLMMTGRRTLNDAHDAHHRFGNAR